MSRLVGYYFEDLKEGMDEIFTKTITDADIVLFAGLSCDTNPVHLDADFAAGTMFKTRIAHGLLSAGFLSAVFGTKMPGPGCVYVNQNLRFKAPVRVGDTVVAKVTLTKLIPEKKFVEFKTQCIVGDKVVIDGEATLMVPSKNDA
jgi:3-hydroxybutyryl-CoA dehydratase